MGWWHRNTASIEALAAVVTAVVAVVALIGVKIQIDEADRLQKVQSARDAYRAHLVLAVEHPQFTETGKVCEQLNSDQSGAYQAFVDHLLYSAEQMLAVGEGWQETFLGELETHGQYLCSDDAPAGDTDETIALLSKFRTESCPALNPCN